MKFGFIFPGQGSQAVGMGREFYEEFPSCKKLLENSCDFCGINFKELLFTENDKLNISEFTQPAIVLNSIMAYLALKEKLDIDPQVCMGHSLGEFTALAVSKALSIENTIKLVNIRGKLMQEACNGKNASMMVVLGLCDEEVEKICDTSRKEGKLVWAANYNCDGQIVVAGDRNDLISLEAKFKDAGAKRAMLLNMSVASHCPILKEASMQLITHLEPMLNNNFNTVIANVNARPYNTKEQALKLLQKQLVSPVLYKQSIIYLNDKVECFVEFGACVLKGMNKKITKIPTFSITNLHTLEEFINFVKENS